MSAAAAGWLQAGLLLLALAALGVNMDLFNFTKSCNVPRFVIAYVLNGGNHYDDRAPKQHRTMIIHAVQSEPFGGCARIYETVRRWASVAVWRWD